MRLSDSLQPYIAYKPSGVEYEADRELRDTEQIPLMEEGGIEAFLRREVLSNRKAAHRQGKVQLIDATQWFRPLRKNLGSKNCEMSGEAMEVWTV